MSNHEKFPAQGMRQTRRRFVGNAAALGGLAGAARFAAPRGRSHERAPVKRRDDGIRIGSMRFVAVA
jgi:hypothetical protein